MTKTNLTASIKLLMFLSLTIPFNLMAQEKSSNQIVAEGASKIKIKPDLVDFTLTVGKTDTSETKVLGKLNTEVQDLIKTLYKIGLTDKIIKVADYNVSSSMNNKDKKIYTASNILNLEFTINSKLINQLYKQIQASQLKDLDISYETSLSDSLEKVTRQMLVQKALADAKSNADNIANTLNLKIVGVKQVSKYATDLIDQDKVEIERFKPPKIVKDEDVETETSFDNFQVVDIDLDEKITIVYEIANK
jgi:uncharacterized protein YggE